MRGAGEENWPLLAMASVGWARYPPITSDWTHNNPLTLDLLWSHCFYYKPSNNLWSAKTVGSHRHRLLSWENLRIKRQDLGSKARLSPWCSLCDRSYPEAHRGLLYWKCGFESFVLPRYIASLWFCGCPGWLNFHHSRCLSGLPIDQGTSVIGPSCRPYTAPFDRARAGG